MAVRDIMPWKSPLGGTYEVRAGAMTTGSTFCTGEPINVVTAGTLTEAPVDNTPWAIADFTTAGVQSMEGGIACFGPGPSVAGGDTNLNPHTGVAFAAGDAIAYWPINQGTLFITDNFFADGTATVVVPAITDIGESYEIGASTTAGILGWGIEQATATAGTEVQAGIVDVLDSRFTSLNYPGNNGTGVYLVFEINATVTAT